MRASECEGWGYSGTSYENFETLGGSKKELSKMYKKFSGHSLSFAYLKALNHDNIRPAFIPLSIFYSMRLPNC